MTDDFVIAQFSDVHCGDARFDEGLMRAMLAEIEELRPDLVAVTGDLTEQGYLEQFDEAREWIDSLSCPFKIVIPGNHDARNVGYMHFDALFGRRFFTQVTPFCSAGDATDETLRIVMADSSKPDLNQGEIGRDRYAWLFNELHETDDAFKIFLLHHHLVSIPGTGRERNILWDAGDILQILAECRVDLVLAGHKHVPYAWHVNGIVIATSGTACTRRTRGRTPPSFNIVRVAPDEIRVQMRNTGEATGRETAFPRRAAAAPKPTYRRGTAEAGVAV